MSDEADRQPTAIYRMFDGDGGLLYVGLTLDPPKRLARHGSRPWFQQVRSITVEWCSSRTEAVRVELRAIATESPAFNVLGRREAEEAVRDLIPRIDALYLVDGMSAGEIAKTLREEGAPTARGGEWGEGSVRKLLDREGIRPRERYEAIQKARSRGPRWGKHVYARIARCGGCGAGLSCESYDTVTMGRRYAWRCSRQNHDGTCPDPQRIFEDVLTERVLEAFGVEGEQLWRLTLDRQAMRRWVRGNVDAVEVDEPDIRIVPA